jgi:hypothetical protein
LKGAFPDFDWETCPRVKTGSGGYHLYLLCKCDESVRFMETTKELPGIEFKRGKRQVVAAGSIHPNGKPYIWDNGVELCDAPEAPEELIEALTIPERESVGGGQVTAEEFAAKLEYLDPTDFRDQKDWFDLMCACHHATAGEGREEFIAWSIQDSKYAGDAWIIGNRWDSLHANKSGAITYTTLNKILRDKKAPTKAQIAADVGDDFEGTDGDEETTFDDPTEAGIATTNAADVKMRNIKFLWKNRLALGVHTAVAGYGGMGKSQVMYNVIATITTGGLWPDGERAKKGRCVILSAEESPEDMIVPRLKAAGADLTLVEIVRATKDGDGRERKFNLQADLATLKKYCREKGDVLLIGFDPVSSYMGGDVDTHRNTAVRHVLDPITKAAEDIGCCILSLTHFNKGSGNKAIHRVMESAAFVNAPRASFGVFEDPENKDAVLFLLLKTNMERPDGLRYRVKTKKVGNDPETQEPIIAPYIAWDNETVSMTADEVVSKQSERKAPALDQAKDFLLEMLKDGPQPINDVKTQADNLCMSEATLRRAVAALGVTAKAAKGHIPPKWEYHLPKDFEEFEVFE